MTHSLTAELVRLNQEIAELRKENDLLWRAHELTMGDPYMHLDGGRDRSINEFAEVSDALRPGYKRRLAEGVSVWCEQNDWLAEREREQERRQQEARSIPSALRRTVMKRDGGCTVCGSTIEMQIDHVIPWSRGGQTVLSNLQVLCRLHNSLKSDLMPDEWAAKLADLRQSDPSTHCCAA